MSKHTPTPWRAVRVGNTLTIAGAVPGYFAEIRGACEGAHGAMGEANAEFIVRAVNAHDDLVAALQNLARLFQALHPSHADWGDYKAALAAIAKATGE